MKNTMHYKGYAGSVEYSEEDHSFFGQVLDIRDLILYEGYNVDELVGDFHAAVDSYLEMCAREGVEPNKPYKGSFNVRISPELHSKAADMAREQQISLNSFVEKAIEAAVAKA